MVRQGGTSAGRFKYDRQTADGGEGQTPPMGFELLFISAAAFRTSFFFSFVLPSMFFAKILRDLPCIGYTF